MRLPLFLVGAIVLAVFGIIATAMTTGPTPGQLFGVTWATWLISALLSYFVHLLLGWAGDAGYLPHRTVVTTQVPPPQ